ncbi:hypothetical protein [Zongyangia hominis]|uniref:YcxB-like protein domain-containing protein n=1 Tax=Zongyangia hominis TaxID=2763677 RepID=A0A926IC10_9FIRM|nr:hypothetical protein [Zongyangia hominis]MBC8570630.1 hypothetical protein [Zongyangia hominis]
MEEKKEVGQAEEKNSIQLDDLSEEDKQLLAEIDAEDMSEEDKEAVAILGDNEWIHADYVIDYDSALEGLNLAAKIKLGAQRGLQTIGLGLVACWFVWPAIKGSKGQDTALLIVGILVILLCAYGMYAVWHFPKKHRLQNAKKYDEEKTPCTLEVFRDHLVVREGEETTVLEYDNKTLMCYNSDNVLLITYNRLDIIIIPKAQLGDQLDRICGVLKAKLMAHYLIKGKQEEKPFDKVKKWFNKAK